MRDQAQLERGRGLQLAGQRLRRTTRRGTYGVNVSAALNLVGVLVKYMSLAFVAPLAFAIAYAESPWPFVGAAAIAFTFGTVVQLVSRRTAHVEAREAFLVVSLVWLVAAAVGAVPFLLSGEQQLASPVDAYFESMSGFTTTGASVLTDIPAVPRSLLLWRQLTQWLGGIGIIVLALAVLPRMRVGGRQLFELEAPGPGIGLTSRIRETAQRFWVLYVALTVLLIGVLLAFQATGVDRNMSFFDAMSHSLSTLPTGGFSTRARGVEEFGAATQWTLALFMVLAGANFALLYAAIARRDLRTLLRDHELRLYIALLAVGALALLLVLVQQNVEKGEAAVRHAVFQSVSVMTTTGFGSTDFATWGPLALAILVGLMFIGGSAGSTAGSVKVVRHLLVGRMLRRELDRTVHPEIVSRVRLNTRAVDERTLQAVIVFVLLYIGLFAVGALAISVDSVLATHDVTSFEAIGAAATTLGNVGPGVGFAGPMGSFAEFSPFAKIVMIALMWLGRLEIIPILVLLTKQYWRA